MSTNKLPTWCAKALRYYVGEAGAYPNVPADPKAYNTLNVLFFEGMESERARARERKRLNAAFLDGASDTLSLCADLLAALRYGGLSHGDEETVYRVSRQVDVEQMRRSGMTVSFTSTSKGVFLTEYADKEKLVLLEIKIAPRAPRADMAELLMTTYAKPEEAEVLLPPWLPVRLAPAPLSADEQRIRDRNGDAPVAKYVVTTGTHIAPPCADAPIEVRRTPCAAGQRVYEALNGGVLPDPEDEKAYIAWKEGFHQMVAKLTFCDSLRDALRIEPEPTGI